MSADELAVSFARAREAVQTADRIAIVTHLRADGDAIGSVAALRSVLRQEGRSAEGILFEPAPPKYAFMLERQPLLLWPQSPARDAWAAADLWIMLDTAAAEQVEPIAPRLAGRRPRLLVIDHHGTRDIHGDIEIVDETAAATALLVAEWCDAAEWVLPSVAADLLFIGLATDTGWFRYDNADARAYAAAARFVRLGVRPADLNRRLFQNDPRERFALFAAVGSAVSYMADGRLAVLEVTGDVLARCSATRAMTEDLVNEPLRIGSVQAAVLLVELEDGRVRVSFRSRSRVDVAAVAQRFGGGGHTLAAGARLPGPLAAARQAVVAAMIAALDGAEG